MGRIISFLIIAVLFLVPVLGQDIGLFLESLPEPGAYADFQITVGSEGKRKEYTLHVAVTKSVKIDGADYLLVEASPQKFLKEKGGTLGLYLKAVPTEEESSNIFLRSGAINYMPKDGSPYALDDSLLKMLKSASAEFKFYRTKKIKGKKVVEVKEGLKTEATVEARDGLIDGSFGFSRLKVREKGEVALSSEVPFGIVEADLQDETYDSSGRIEKIKNIKIKLVGWGFKKAKSVFPEKDLKKKGFWGIIFS